MTIKELAQLKKTKLHDEMNIAKNLNLSSIYCSMVKAAAKCDYYASDIIIDIEQIKKQLAELKAGEDFTYHLGYREMGVDSLCYIVEREPGFIYHTMHLLTAARDHHDDITVTLYQLKI